MTMAVVYLRYHYAVDAIVAALLPLAGMDLAVSLLIQGLWAARLLPHNLKKEVILPE
jgi:hypothetical protein